MALARLNERGRAPRRQQPGGPASADRVEVLDDAELAYNLLQWFGTVVVDGRRPPRRGHRHVVLDAAAAAGLPIKDDAVTVELEPELAAVVAGRDHPLIPSPRALAELGEHPWLLGSSRKEAAGGANLVDGTLLVGHQGHAWCRRVGAAHWAGRASTSPSTASTRARRAHRKRRRRQPLGGAVRRRPALTDGVGDGRGYRRCLRPGGHRQAAPHGRSSCTASRAARARTSRYRLLHAHPGWSLRDALAFLAARRPETELNDEYIAALERWAVSSAALPRSRDAARSRDAHPAAARRLEARFVRFVTSIT